jgi:zinc protease
VVESAPFAETIVHLAFPSPKASHKDVVALEMFALIIGQGESSRLNQRLRMRENLVNYAGASVFAARDPGFTTFSMSLNDRDLPSAMAGLKDELATALSSPISDVELRKALTNLASEQFYHQETVDGLARNYGQYQDLFDDPLYFQKFLRQAEGLTGKAILRTARRYLSAPGAALIIMTPADKSVVEPAARAWMKALGPALRKSARRPIKAAPGGRRKKISFAIPKSGPGTVEKHVLSNGITLITRPNFETPVISLRCASLGGSRLETPATQGATELLSRVWTAGCGDLGEMEMNQKIDEMAASLSAFGGRNSEGLSMSCLRPFFNEMLDLFARTYREPLFEESAVRREIKSMTEHVKLRRDNPAQLCILEFMKNLFPNHPYGRDPYGEETAIERLGQAAVADIYARRSGLTIVASGAVDGADLRRRLEGALGDVAVTNGANKLFPLQYPKRETRVYLNSVKEQSHIIVGFPGLTLREPERYTLQVIQAILAGQGGRLFLELRDKASLAYSVAPMRMEGLEGGYFGAYIGCSPEKAGKALRMMRDEFTKLYETKVHDGELMRAQRYLIGKHDIELQKNSNLTSSILFDQIYDIDFLETYRFTERIRAVTADGILGLARKIFSRPAVISVVGPKPAWADGESV